MKDDFLGTVMPGQGLYSFACGSVSSKETLSALWPHVTGT